MNETKPINQPAQGKNGKNKSGIAATVGAAAAAGIGGAAAAYAATRNDEDVQPEEKPEDTTQAEQETSDTNEQHQSSAQTQPQQQAAPQGQPAASASTEPQPQASSDVTGDEVDNTEETEQGLEEDIEVIPENPETQQVENNPTDQEETIVSVDETELPPENPDEIAEAIISEEMIDPNDIDMADVINFDEIGTVYNVNGEATTVVSFHDDQGNHLTMIDIDGDDVLDVLGDEDGNAFVDENGDLVALGTGTTVGDAEIEINDDDTYLAADDNNLDEFGADSLAEDMLG